VRSSRGLSGDDAQRLIAEQAEALLPGENVRFVGTCEDSRSGLRTFLITDTRAIGADAEAVRFIVRGSAFDRVEVNAAERSATLTSNDGTAHTIDGIAAADVPDVEEELLRLQARTSPAAAPPQAPPPPPPPTAPAVTMAGDTSASFDVLLVAVGKKPIQVIKEVRALTDLSLKDAKELVDGLPLPVLRQASPELAATAQRRLTEVGASVRLEPRGDAPREPTAVSPTDARRTYGNALRAPAQRAVDELSGPGESPWLVINPGGATGALVAFEDRLAIVKTGAMTGLLAGATFGGRQAVFYFTEVTGIEYNSGLLNGVLQILTPSYDGSANKDFWKGTNRSRNADSNDPFTLSNTLPMAKFEYRACQDLLAELRRRIAESKRIVVTQQAAPAAASMADEIGRLAELQAAGLLSPEEFTAAKQKLIGG